MAGGCQNKCDMPNMRLEEGRNARAAEAWSEHIGMTSAISDFDV